MRITLFSKGNNKTNVIHLDIENNIYNMWKENSKLLNKLNPNVKELLIQEYFDIDNIRYILNNLFKLNKSNFEKNCNKFSKNLNIEKNLNKNNILEILLILDLLDATYLVRSILNELTNQKYWLDQLYKNRLSKNILIQRTEYFYNEANNAMNNIQTN